MTHSVSDSCSICSQAAANQTQPSHSVSPHSPQLSHQILPYATHGWKPSSLLQSLLFHRLVIISTEWCTMFLVIRCEVKKNLLYMCSVVRLNSVEVIHMFCQILGKSIFHGLNRMHEAFYCSCAQPGNTYLVILRSEIRKKNNLAAEKPSYTFQPDWTVT